ncbi:ABC transporter permease [Spiroplasma floricola]|uniref:ABC transporter permease n=1 Tax=Spiroplasma floricola TaxID=216937 RepID=UPI000C2D158F|nr:ABC transporter permease [Spiroplasma floricola]
MKGIRLLLKNAFKSSWKNKSQIIGLSLLVMLVSLVTSVLSATSTRVAGAYDKLIVSSNMKDYILDVNLDNQINDPNSQESKEENLWDKLSDYKVDKTIVQNKELYQQYILNQIALKYNLDISYTEARLLNGVKNNNESMKIKTVSKINSDTNNGVDKLVVSRGRNFNAGVKEVVINESFAKANDIKLNDIIRVNSDKYGDDFLVKNSNFNSQDGKKLKEDLNQYKDSPQDLLKNSRYENQVWFEVVGIGTSADFITPIIDETTIMPNTKNEAIIYMDSIWMGYQSDIYSFTDKKNENNLYKRKMSTYTVQTAKVVVASEKDREVYFSIKSNDSPSEELRSKMEDEYKQYISVNIKDLKYIYDAKDPLYKFATRTTSFDSVMIGYNVMANGLIIVIILIAGFTTILTTKKQVEQQSRQIGCLKSLGYKKREIVNNFIAIPLIVSIIGSLAGYILSIFIESEIVGVFSTYFNISFFKFQFNPVAFAASLLALWVLLTILTFSIGYWTIKKSALTLLKGGDDKVINKLSIKIKQLSSKRSFNYRLRTALLTTSLGKLVGVSVTMLLSATLITTTVIAPKVMKDNITATFNGMNYENMVEYTQPIANNPWSFYKTYNPNFESENTGWGQYKEQVLIRDAGAGKKITGNGILQTTPAGFTKGWTAYPIKDGVDENQPSSNDINNSIDWEKVVQELLKGEISPYYYTYDIAADNVFFWSEFSYLNWRNMSTNLLRNLDKATATGLLTSGTALQTLQGQWPDYTQLMKELSSMTKTPSKTELREYTFKMLKIYNKYIQGLSLTYNEGSVKDNKFVHNFINNKFNKEIKNNKKNYYDKNLLNKIKPVEEKTADFVWIKEDEKEISPLDLTDSQINEMTENELKELNTGLTYWFGATLDGRMGMAVLQTTYTRATYFVQEAIKKAIQENSNYNISFNIIPYDNKQDELGTVLNTKFKTVNNKQENAKIFGINQNSSLIDLKNSKNKDLKRNLFLSEDSDTIPLIINQSFAKKTNKNAGDIVNLEVLRDMLYQNDKEISLDDVTYGHNLENDKAIDFSELRTQSTYGWYTNDYLYADSPTASPLPVGKTVSASSIGQSNTIASSKADKAVETMEIYKNYRNGQLSINQEILNKQFKIVGIQNGYGQPQCWISNDNANKILGYDKINEKNFEQWFAKEYPKGNPIYKYEGFNDQIKVDNLSLEEFMGEKKFLIKTL